MDHYVTKFEKRLCVILPLLDFSSKHLSFKDCRLLAYFYVISIIYWNDGCLASLTPVMAFKETDLNFMQI